MFAQIDRQRCVSRQRLLRQAKYRAHFFGAEHAFMQIDQIQLDGPVQQKQSSMLVQILVGIEAQARCGIVAYRRQPGAVKRFARHADTQQARVQIGVFTAITADQFVVAAGALHVLHATQHGTAGIKIKGIWPVKAGRVRLLSKPARQRAGDANIGIDKTHPLGADMGQCGIARPCQAKAVVIANAHHRYLRMVRRHPVARAIGAAVVHHDDGAVALRQPRRQRELQMAETALHVVTKVSKTSSAAGFLQCSQHS